MTPPSPMIVYEVNLTMRNTIFKKKNGYTK